MLPSNVQRRVAGHHEIRMDGMVDLLVRAGGARVLDLGCNRGMVGYEFYCNGAIAVHGADNYENGIMAAREIFADLRSCESKFEVVDLAQGKPAFDAAFGDQMTWDITLCIATLHKLKRQMGLGPAVEFMRYLCKRTTRFFGWRGISDTAGGEQTASNLEELAALDEAFKGVAVRIHTSTISEQLGHCAIWRRT